MKKTTFFHGQPADLCGFNVGLIMEKEGAILIVDDDVDNHFLIEKIFQKLRITNPRKFFENGKEALEYLQNDTERPFLIFSDIHMPVMDGFDFRAAINASDELREKCIPFIFLTTTIRTAERERAKKLCVQGFLDKGKTFEDLGNALKLALEYWQSSFYNDRVALRC